MYIRRIALITYIVSVFMLLTACNYKPPYDRGYDEGYQAGYTAAGGEAAAAAQTQAASVSQQEVSSEPKEKSHLMSIMSTKKEDSDKADEDSDSGEDTDAPESDETADTAEDEASAQITEETADVQPDESQTGEAPEGAEVLGNGSGPSDDGGGSQGSAIPEGRIITADAVNEALYSHPEVIDGLRQIYADTAIFGEYVGDSETNMLHKVNGPHFAELGYDTIVVFDGSKSLQDILNEGFYTKCSCIDQ